MREVTVRAFAKLNLTLDILYKRRDGYHELRMVMQAVSLCDELTVRVGTGGGELLIRTDCAALPDGPGNLAWKAAHTFFETTGLSGGGTEISLVKRIPACAGMAGGSSDAAAVLRALRRLLAPDLSDRALETMGERIGSDVPFCVRGGAALAEGRGERLTALPAMAPCQLVICKPDFDLPTPQLFGRVRAEQITCRPDTAAMERALRAGDLSETAKNLRNVFEDFLLENEKDEIDSIRQTLLGCGALGAAMTGSGPTVFGVFRPGDAAQKALRLLQKRYAQTFLANPLG